MYTETCGWQTRSSTDEGQEKEEEEEEEEEKKLHLPASLFFFLSLSRVRGCVSHADDR